MQMVLNSLKQKTKVFFQKRKSNLQTYSNLATLPILIFWEIIKTDNHKLLDLSYSETKEYSDAELQQIENVWSNLYDAFFVLVDNKEAKYFLKKNVDRLQLLQKIAILNDAKERVVILYNLGSHKDFQEFVFNKKHEIHADIKFIQPRVKLNLFADLEDYAETIDLLVKSLENTYNEVSNVKEKKADKEIDSIYKKAVKIGRVLGMQLNVNQMMTEEFYNWEKEAIEVSKNNSNGK